MVKGRKPTPTRLKVLSGNPGKRPLPANEPKPDRKSAAPRAPQHLSDAAKKEWRRIAKELHACGLLSAIDTEALSMFCTAFGRWVEAEERIQRHGVIIKSPSGYPIQSPYLAIANKAMDQMRALLSEFGMSPAARTRVEVEPTGSDDFEAFAKGAARAKQHGA